MPMEMHFLENCSCMQHKLNAVQWGVVLLSQPGEMLDSKPGIHVRMGNDQTADLWRNRVGLCKLLR